MSVFTDSRMRRYWDRLGWNVSHILTGRWLAYNPYVLAGENDLKPKKRTAWIDLLHSIKNIWVEYGKLKSGERQ